VESALVLTQVSVDVVLTNSLLLIIAK